MKSHTFGDYTYLELKSLADAGCLAILPTGCIEQQGPHLPVDFDAWFAESVALEAAQLAAESYGAMAVVLPVIPFGPTPEHQGYGSGYVNIPHPLHEDLVYSSLRSLAEQGFSRIMVWRGCGEHRLQQAVARFNSEFRPKSEATLPDLPHHAIWCRIADPSIPGGHADSFTTSIALHRRPGTVKRELIPSASSKEVNWDEEHIDFTKYSDTGVIGDATKASAELGSALWDEEISVVAKLIREAISS